MLIVDIEILVAHVKHFYDDDDDDNDDEDSHC